MQACSNMKRLIQPAAQVKYRPLRERGATNVYVYNNNNNRATCLTRHRAVEVGCRAPHDVDPSCSGGARLTQH